MLDGQKLQLEATEKRAALRKMALDPETKTEDLTTAEAELTTLETRARIAVAAEEEVVKLAKVEPTEDSETRERRELRSKARVSDFVGSVLSGRPVAGASAEYADAVGVPGLMPMELLEVEERAVTPGPADDTVTATRPTVPYAFSRTDAAALGVVMPMVAPGEAHFPALTTAPPADAAAENIAALSTAAAFSLTKRTPSRITGQFVLRVEDLALMPSMETDLRRAIGAAMANNLDSQVINGDGAGANLSGLFTAATDEGAAAAVEDFGTAIARFAGLVDGIHAHGWANIRAIIGVATFAKYASIFANANKGDISAYDVLTSKLGGAQGEHESSYEDGDGREGAGRPGRARPADNGSDLARCGTDCRSVHPGREGAAGRDGGNARRLSVRALRRGSGYRDSPEAQLTRWTQARRESSCGREAMGRRGRVEGSRPRVRLLEGGV